MARLARRVSIAWLITACSAAYAQCGGINTGGGNCTPPNAPGMPGYVGDNAPNAAQPPAAYITQWGAIVLDDGGAGAGTVTGRSTERAAEKDALDDCASKGGRSCRVALTYDNECAAVAWTPGSYFLSSAPKTRDAEGDAMVKCNAKAADCKIVYSACSLPRKAD